MRVLKFGGSSVKDAESINKVVAIVKKALKKDKTIVTVSALGGTTDSLIDIVNSAASHKPAYKDKISALEKRHIDTAKDLLGAAQQKATIKEINNKFKELASICEGVYLLQELSPRTLDSVVSYGELLSSLIISAKFTAAKVSNKWVDSREVIRTNSDFGAAIVDNRNTTKAVKAFVKTNKSKLAIMPGFIAANEKGITTTLGRGGSDYTAALVAAAVGAKELEIWTDVSGMMTADPRLVANVKVISTISYQEAMELSHFGAKVIYPPTIQPVMDKNIPIRIKNTFSPEDEGTQIVKDAKGANNNVRGISTIGKITLLSIEGSGMVGVPGISKRVFGTLSSKNVNIVLITQASSEHSICVAIDDKNAAKAKAALDEEFAYELSIHKINPTIVEKGLSIIAVVGENMKNHTGISGKMFKALGRNGVNIRAIAQGSSEKNISTVIKTEDVKKAVNVIHEDFFETAYKQVNLFIAGCGNVGSKLIEQLHTQASSILDNQNIELRVIGIANSKRVLIDEHGINLNNWQAKLKKAKLMNTQEYVDFIISKNVRNSVFVDITAHEVTANVYGDLLKKSVSVVACNKIACSSDYSKYKQLQDYAREFNAGFLYETNVGAALPVIGTLKDVVSSGDKVTRIEAVLSGTLNYVFNEYDTTKSFAEVVKIAQDEGYTEPDPRLDLGGTDVMRKILILARDAGHKLELKDIKNNTFMPAACMKGSVADFYKATAKHEGHFKKLYDDAAKKDCILKVVATLKNGKASVGLEHIDKKHDMYHLYGKDNIVLFYTNRYSEQPLVVKGAGAGADVTASGIFADIMRAARG